RKRVGRTIEIPCNMKGYKFRPGMYVKVTISQIGMRNVEMRVTKWSFNPKGGVDITLRQDFLEMWDDAIGKPMDRPDLVDLPSGGVAQPQNLQYQILQISDVVQGVLSWTNMGQVAYNRVAVRQGGVTIWTAQVPGQSVRVTGLLRGAYTAHVQAVSHGGAISPEAYVEFNFQAPLPLSSVEVQNGYFSLTLIPKISELTNVSTQFDFWTSG
ncbi:phage tail tip protein J-related protein, partial [Dyella japonica]|uniref:phage tail tip protein J-related protein n=1 Tax=Dyella japonica TaxID=231455 RepID=UPI00062DB9A8